MRRRLFLAGSGALALVPALVPGAALAAQGGKVPVVFGYLAAWNFHSVERAVSYFAENVVYFDAAVGTPIEGKAAAASGVVANFINAAPDLVWGMRGRPLVSDGQVAFEWAFSGTNSGAWADGTAATGRRFAFTGASVFEIRDSLIVRQSDYYDALGFYRQLGWA